VHPSRAARMHEWFISSSSSITRGTFPLWLAPDQVRVITLNGDAALIEYAKPIACVTCERGLWPSSSCDGPKPVRGMQIWLVSQRLSILYGIESR
jgi:hypothetical protein